MKQPRDRAGRRKGEGCAAGGGAGGGSTLCGDGKKTVVIEP